MAAVKEAHAEPTQETPPETERRTKDKPKPRRQPKYAVILHNDDLNTFEFVIGVLLKVFQYGRIKATMLTLQAHVAGRSAVWTGVLEVAELKADQIRSCGADPAMAAKGARQLRVTLEPLPE